MMEESFRGMDRTRKEWEEKYEITVSYKNIDPLWDPVEDRIQSAADLADKYGASEEVIIGAAYAYGIPASRIAEVKAASNFGTHGVRSLASDEYGTVTSFAERAKQYYEMQRKLDELGIDVSWFQVAGDLNTFFSNSTVLWGLWNYIPDEIEMIGQELFEYNLGTYNAIARNAMPLSGIALDYYLVRKEQLTLERLIHKAYPHGVPVDLRVHINASFTQAGRYMGTVFAGGRVAQAIARAEQRIPGRAFDFWNVDHRIALGDAMVELTRADF